VVTRLHVLRSRELRAVVAGWAVSDDRTCQHDSARAIRGEVVNAATRGSRIAGQGDMIQNRLPRITDDAATPAGRGIAAESGVSYKGYPLIVVESSTVQLGSIIAVHGRPPQRHAVTVEDAAAAIRWLVE